MSHIPSTILAGASERLGWFHGKQKNRAAWESLTWEAPMTPKNSQEVLKALLIKQAGLELVIRALLDTHPDKGTVLHWLELESRNLEQKALFDEAVHEADVQLVLEEIQRWLRLVRGQ